jgi:hypothetical protein
MFISFYKHLGTNSIILNLDLAGQLMSSPTPCLLCPAPDHPVNALVSELPMSVGTRPPDSYASGA